MVSFSLTGCSRAAQYGSHCAPCSENMSVSDTVPDLDIQERHSDASEQERFSLPLTIHQSLLVATW